MEGERMWGEEKTGGEVGEAGGGEREREKEGETGNGC